MHNEVRHFFRGQDYEAWKQMKAALAANSRQYRHLFESLPIKIFQTTPDGRSLDANHAFG